MAWIAPKMSFHIFVNLFLQIDSDGTVDANYFISADTGVSGHIAARIRNADIRRFVTNSMVSALNRRSNKSLSQCSTLRIC